MMAVQCRCLKTRIIMCLITCFGNNKFFLIFSNNLYFECFQSTSHLIRKKYKGLLSWEWNYQKDLFLRWFVTERIDTIIPNVDDWMCTWIREIFLKKLE